MAEPNQEEISERQFQLDKRRAIADTNQEVFDDAMGVPVFGRRINSLSVQLAATTRNRKPAGNAKLGGRHGDSYDRDRFLVALSGG
jgi:hypothetical protein